MPTLEEIRAELKTNPITIPEPLTKEAASQLMLNTFEGCEREIIETYLTGPKDTNGIAVRRGDVIKITDPNHKKFGEWTTVTRIIREYDQNTKNVTIRILGKGKFETTLENIVRQETDDPIRDIVSACAKVMREDGPKPDPTA